MFTQRITYRFLFWVGVFVLLKTNALLALPHPFLFFDANDRSGLQSKVGSGVSKRAFDRLRTAGDDMHEAQELALRYAINPTQYDNLGNQAADLLVQHATAGNLATIQTDLDNTEEYSAAYQLKPYAIVYDLVYNKLSASEKTLVRNWIFDACEIFKNNLTATGTWRRAKNNHINSQYGAMGLGALAILDDGHPQRAELLDWISKTKDKVVADVFNNAYEEGGQYFEGHSYDAYGGIQCVLFAEAYNRYFNTNIFANTNVLKTFEWRGYMLMPDGNFPEYGDNSDRYDFASEYLVLFKYNPNPVYKWWWNQIHPNGTDRPPQHFGSGYNLFIALWYPENISEQTPAQAGFQESGYLRDNAAEPSGGMVTLRNGWGSDKVALWLTSRRAYHNHQHYDQGAFRITAYGARFTNDEDFYGYSDDLHGVMHSHSTVIIDAGAMPECSGSGTEDGSALGRVVGFHPTAFADYVRMDGRFPYADISKFTRCVDQTSFGQASDTAGDSHYVTPIQRADRAIVLMKGTNPYYILADDVKRDNSSHLYSWLSHTDLDRASGTGSPTNPFLMTSPTSTNVEITIVDPTGFIDRLVDHGPPGGPNLTTAITVEKSGVNPLFLSILYPRKSGMERPVIARTSTAGNAGATISWSGGIVDTALYTNGTIGSAGGLDSNARLAVVRRQGATITGYVVGEGSNVIFQTTNLINTDGVRAGVVYSGTEVRVVGTGLKNASFYAPNATRLLINNQNANFTRNGNYINMGQGNPPADTVAPATPRGFRIR